MASSSAFFFANQWKKQIHMQHPQVRYKRFVYFLLTCECSGQQVEASSCYYSSSSTFSFSPPTGTTFWRTHVTNNICHDCFLLYSSSLKQFSRVRDLISNMMNARQRNETKRKQTSQVQIISPENLQPNLYNTDVYHVLQLFYCK
jgi:hypothetical protein